MLKRILPEFISAADIDLLISADMSGPGHNHLQPAVVISSLFSGDFQLFRCPYGVFLTEINTGGDGSKRLNIVRCAGRELALRFQEISRDLQHIAREFGCNAIETLVYSEKMAKALTRGGAKQEAISMVLEL